MTVLSITWFAQLSDDEIINDTKAGGWKELALNQAGDRIKSAEYSDRTIHIHGNFSGSATLTMRGSAMNEPNPEITSHWFTLSSGKDGCDITAIDAIFGAVLLENPLWLSPLVVGGDGSTAINVDITMKKGT